jgi:gliding motility-associated-like protein
MRSLLRLFIFIILFVSLSDSLSAQNCFNTGLNGTVINLPCNQTCVNVPVRIPHLKGTSDYKVNAVPYNPFPFVNASGVALTSTYVDDKFSTLIDLPFTFCFYDSLYTKCVVGSNGVMTFDEICANADNAYTLTNTGGTPQPIPYNVGTAPGGIATTYYPRASIMGAYHDIDPSTVSNPPPERRIEYNVIGTAPCRKFIVSYFHVPMFGTGCNNLLCTQQIVLYESTGVVEVYFENKPVCNSWPSPNPGIAILGIQNWARNQAVAAPGKNCTVWNESNTAYQFVPSGGVSRFVSCQVQTLAGVFIALGDTATTTAGLLDVTFPTFCPAGTGGQYVVKTTFSACDNPTSQITSYDTITINKTNSLNATAVVTPTSCGLSGSGTATVTVPAGIGTAPYTFVLNPGSVTLTGNSPQQFIGLNAGNYTVTVTDNSGGCSSIVPITITSTGALAVTYNIINTSCVGAPNGSITVNPPNGTPPITYSINGGAFSTTNVFNNLAPGTYFISTHDNAGCVADFIPVTVNVGPSITLTYTTTPTSCTGANNGSITITPTGTAPFQYAINGGPYQSSNIFSNLPAGTHFIDVKDAVGCTISFYPITVDPGSGTLTGTATPTPTSCTGVNNGIITVTPTSGSGPYTYSLNSGPYQASNVFTGLAPGAYTITIKEAGLCTSGPIPVTITVGPALTATATTAATSCNGAADGTITVTPTNGTGPYTYALDAGTPQAGNIFTGVSSGNHSIVVKDVAGCASAPIPVTVAAGPALTGTAVSTATSCPGVNNGTITATATNGTGPYTYALDAGTAQASNIFSNVAAGPHTIIIRNTAGCISASIPVTVTAGTGLTATLTPTPTTCTGVNNGTITVTPTNGTGPYTFVLDGTTTQNGATANFTGVATGSHNISITDAIGCTTTAALTVNVTAGAGFTATYTATNTACTGVSTGSITVTPGAGGTGPYTFVLDGTVTHNGPTNTIFTNVGSGSHSILITDANGCQFTLNNANVAVSAGFTATFTATATSCTGAANGSITVTPGAGGTGPYTFVLDGTTTQNAATSTTFNNVASGTHIVLITDAIGCQFTLNNASVAAGAGFTATFTATTTTCSGAANGSITVTPGAGGTGPYTFVLDGTTTQTGATNTTFNNLASGTHSVLITDANGCQFTLNNANVTPGAPLAAVVTPVATACPGVNNGSIVVTPGNGNGPYTFVLDGTITQTGATTTTFFGVAAGAHTIGLTDVNGCNSTLPPVNVASGTGVTANVVPTGTSCTGAINGSITITPTNGTGPYTFVLNGTTTQTGATTTTFSALAAGSSYSIVITDAIGCSGTFNNINVPQGSALLANAVASPTTCNGAANGQIIVTPTNGAGPYTFVLNGTVTQTGAINTTFINLAAATYNIVVTDGAGCVSSPVTSTVNAGPAITVSLVKTDARCFGAATGSITATPSANASALIEYSLDNVTWQASPNFNSLVANPYTVYIRDGVGCTNSATITVGQPTQLSATTSVQNVLCNGQSNGVITVTATGGTAPYSYSLDNVTFQPANTFTVAAGVYTIYVKDANNCAIPPINNVTVTQPAVLTATATSGNATCDGGNDGTITVTALGGTLPYQYSLNGTIFQASNILNTAPGTYNTVTVKDANGCTFPVASAAVGLTNNLTLTPAIDPAPICEGNSTQLQVVTNATQFAWTGANLSSTTIANPIAKPTAPSNLYTVIVTLGRCSATDDVQVIVMQAPIPNAGIDGDICYGQTYTLQPVGDPTFTYTWTPSTNLSSSTGFNPVSDPDKTIIYTLSVTDANGCTSLVTDQVIVKVTPPIQVTTYPIDTVVYAGVPIPLLATSLGTSYTWSPAAGLNNPNIANPIATASMIDGSVVTYKVTTTTSAGCQGDGFITIRVYKGPDIYMPTGFTPNGDGKNDQFIPFPVGIKKLNYFRVFNRWGQMLFTTVTLNRGWDGTFGGVEQASGVYVWMAEGVTMDNKIITKKGTVTLIR